MDTDYTHENQLLTTKISIPPTYLKKSIERPHLYERLEKGIQDACTLLIAPAGFGKTSLVSTWLTYRHSRASWLTLDSNDNEPKHFWRYILKALSRHHPEILTGIEQWPEHPPMLDNQTLLTLFINILNMVPEEIILVLDNYQAISKPIIHQLLTFFVERQPPQFHLILLSRIDPPLPLTRLRARGQLNELRSQDLRFGIDEAATFLQQALSFSLSIQELHKLYWYTEGWPAGLQLAALSLQKYSDATAAFAAIQAFSGENRQIFHYLNEEVLAQLPKEIIDFLLATSILDSFTIDLCNMVAGQQNAQECLDYLQIHDIFLIPLDEQGNWYRYHHLFTDLLRQHLKQRPQLNIAQLHERASEWYETHDQVVEAIDHAFEAGNVERAASLIEHEGLSLIHRGQLLLVQAWLVRLPEHFSLGRPLLSYIYSYLDLLQMHYTEYERHLERAEKIWQQERNNIMLRLIYDMRAYEAAMHGKGSQAVEYAQKALSLLEEEESSIYGTATISLGVGYQLLGNLTQARSLLLKGYHLCQKNGQGLPAYFAALHLAEIHIGQGRLHEAVQSLRQLLPETNEYLHFYRSLVHLHLCHLYRQWNNLTTAQAHWQQAALLIEKTQFPRISPLESYLQSALLAWAQNLYEQALQALGQAEQYPELNDHQPLMRARLTACHVQILLANGKAEDAQQVLEEHLPILEKEKEKEIAQAEEREIWAMAQARVYIAQHEYQQAQVLLMPLLSLAREQSRKDSVLRILLLLGLAHQGQGTVYQAFQQIEQALILAKPGGYIRVFLDEGPAMQNLLQEYMQVVQQRGLSEQQQLILPYVRSLLTHFSPEIQQQPWKASRFTEQSLEKLSERELTVLHLIADGLSNQELASRLLVSVSTIKTHLNNIYAKLHVHTRLQAVTKAYDLGILVQDEADTEGLQNQSFPGWIKRPHDQSGPDFRQS